MSDAEQQKEVKELSMKSAKTLVTDWFKRFDERLDGVKNYVSSCFNQLDSAFPGWLHNGHLVVVAARPAMGKTSLVLQIAEHVAQEKTVVFYTLEMCGEELIERSISRKSSIPVSKLKTAEECDYEEEEFSKMQDAIKELIGLPIYIDGGVYDVDTLYDKSLRFSARLNKVLENQESDDSDIDKSIPLKPLGLIVVDYLQMVKSAGQNRTIEIGDVSRKLKQLSKELKVPVIALAQLNRSLESRPDKRPILSDLRESGQIEQDADFIAFIYRDEIYNPDTQDKGIAEIIVGKNRHGATGTHKMAWRGNRMMFADLVHMPESYTVGHADDYDDEFDWN